MIRSTFSSNSSQPCSRASTVRSVGILAQLGLAVLGLIAAERDADDVDVVLLHRSDQRPAPPAADVEQRHSRSRFSLFNARSSVAFWASSRVMSSRSK